MNSWFFSLGAIFAIVLYLLLFAFIAWGLYAVIRGAVRTALDDHYRKVQWYEETGLWYSGRPPKGLPGATQLNRDERKNLPKTAKPEKGA
ncbi:hypothetical protein [Gryllotalpicola ginsengisoli]|uniref:hypothetical protein n=1 Tax=Gryllotalpicola ginsengisoli TaxID=444608 RepID=UPI000406BC7E|nr:hypothetical protein [Gryllotalpicola ginsengisoli]